MTTQIMYDKGLRCKGRGFNCEGCRDKNECIEYEIWEPKNTEYAPTLQFKYKNYKGKTNIRNVIPYNIHFGSTEFHPQEQWLLRAFDVDKCAERNFALKDVIKFIWKEKIC